MPAGWLIDGLGMNLSNGSTIQYIDKNGVVRFMDPSVSMEGRSAALVDREAFLSFLEQQELVVICTISGEKNVYGKGHDAGFGGRLTFTRVIHSHGADMIALNRYETFERPSASQLATLKKAQAGEGD